MAEVRPEFQELDREELLILCQELTGRCFLHVSDLAEMILRARWEVAVDRAGDAYEIYSDAFNEAMDLKKRPGKLTSARLAEEEKAERRWRKLSRAELKARTYERDLWQQIEAGWNQKGDAA